MRIYARIDLEADFATRPDWSEPLCQHMRVNLFNLNLRHGLAMKPCALCISIGVTADMGEQIAFPLLLILLMIMAGHACSMEPAQQEAMHVRCNDLQSAGGDEIMR